MSMTRRYSGTQVPIVALVIGLGLSSTAKAAPVSSINYNTIGTISSEGVSGPGVISFNSIAAGRFDAPSTFSLGEFLLAAPSEGVTTTYADTPFHITFTVLKVDGTPPDPNTTPFILNGVLNGQVTGSSQSSVVATFDPASTAVGFQTGPLVDTLSVLQSSRSLVPSSSNGGRTSAEAKLLAASGDPGTPPQTIPEPATLALFVTAMVGVGLRRRVLSVARG